MTEPRANGESIQDTDIIFRCKACGKSLAIDPRGAGLTVKCSDCGKTVSVPEQPARDDSGAELARLRKRVQELEQSLRKTRAMASEYAGSLQELQTRRKHLEKAHAEDLGRLDIVQRAISTIRKALADMEKALGG